MTEPQAVKVGQVWEPNDPRLKPAAREKARFEILAVDGAPWTGNPKPGVLVRNVVAPHRRRTIALNRFKPNANGYSLVHETKA